MAFDQTDIADQRHAWLGGDLLVSWTSTAPAGSLYQVYVGGRLLWWGTDLSARLPMPAGRTAIEVGVVDADEGPVDFSGDLPAAPEPRARLEWMGGTYLSPTISGYSIHTSPTPGGTINDATPVEVVPAYRGSISDGWNLGGWNEGGWGQAASTYEWVSPPLANGTWTFRVVPIDRGGQPCASPTTVNVVIAGPPRPPAPDGQGRRLWYTFDEPSGVATLDWNASPAADSPLDPLGPE